MKVGAQYTFHLGTTMNLTARADYYWRDAFYARIFNRPIDTNVFALDPRTYGLVVGFRF